MTRAITRPQTLALPAAPGSLLKRLHGIKRVREIESERDEAYLEQIRLLLCLRCGMEDFIEAAHVRMQSGAHGKHGGIGKKPAHKWALPLCAACHRLDKDSQHKIGEREFWGRLGLDPLLICDKLYTQRGDVVAMRAVIVQAIAERG